MGLFDSHIGVALAMVWLADTGTLQNVTFFSHDSSTCMARQPLITYHCSIPKFTCLSGNIVLSCLIAIIPYDSMFLVGKIVIKLQFSMIH